MSGIGSRRSTPSSESAPEAASSPCGRRTRRRAGSASADSRPRSWSFERRATAWAKPSSQEAGGKRLFVKEIEDALADGRVDVAVHSTKDMPVEMPQGLEIGAFLPRADPWDALVLPAVPGAEAPGLREVVAALGSSPRLGTSSVRRVTQLHRLIPGATFEPIRGNVETRLRKLDEGQYDAIVLACAGLQRLGLASRITVTLPVSVAVPAPGQGAVALQVRTDRGAALAAALPRIDDRATRAAATAERVIVHALEGGCQSPIGAVAVPHGDGLELHAAVTSLEGEEIRAMALRPDRGSDRARSARRRATARAGRGGSAGCFARRAACRREVSGRQYLRRRVPSCHQPRGASLAFPRSSRGVPVPS